MQKIVDRKGHKIRVLNPSPSKVGIITKLARKGAKLWTFRLNKKGE